MKNESSLAVLKRQEHISTLRGSSKQFQKRDGHNVTMNGQELKLMRWRVRQRLRAKSVELAERSGFTQNGREAAARKTAFIWIHNQVAPDAGVKRKSLVK